MSRKGIISTQNFIIPGRSFKQFFFQLASPPQQRCFTGTSPSSGWGNGGFHATLQHALGRLVYLELCGIKQTFALQSTPIGCRPETVKAV